ncbi:hydroxymethylbilane synthase [Desulfoglaeba alkanexedens]|uniref:Porphobilinogen deaminase n=1 Tax=Desulfoglaeba alkanexedens ALDC TaxID=980445 RepID=A0A4P8L402_9BACT|nr:hydroxymethylbilane synthase [Desulfoglaeba alkanexedens]QCQ22524.1 hydroxymethylbilane synthase [Desulfoglaeba alkanexedens ALDC]
MNRTLRIGTRGSLLALRQSEQVKAALSAMHPELRIELKIIKTTGDKILDVPLAKVGGKGLFVKEIEEALLARQVDLAVHSMKDVPAMLPEGLGIAAVPAREDPRDVLVSGKAGTLEELPHRAVIGTGSLRRGAQALALRPDLRVETLRGNLDTRLRKARDGSYDAVILAAAGLHRMGWKDRITAYLDPDVFIPAIGQGALGIEARADDREVWGLLRGLHDVSTASAVTAERAFLKELEGGCQVPIGGHAQVLGASVALTGLVVSLDGRTLCRETRQAPCEEAERLGRELARELLDRGARTILEEVYRGA